MSKDNPQSDVEAPVSPPRAGARKGLFFLFAEGYLGLILQTIGMVFIARLLTPVQQGLFGVAAALTAIASTVRDFGAAEYLIQKTTADADDFRRTFALNLIVSWSMFLLLFFASGPIARFYGNMELQSILKILSINFILIPFGAVTMAWHRRQMNFEPGFWSGLFTNLTTFSVGLALAFAGFGAASLAWGALAGCAVSVAVSLYFSIPNMPRTPLFSGLGDVFRFGKHVVGIYVFGQIGKSAPELIIGRMLSLPSVAFFGRGGSLYELFSRLVVRAVSPLCLPYFATAIRAQKPLQQPYANAVSLLTILGWPFLFVVGFYSELIIRILYGNQWGEATVIAKLLCLAGAIELIHIFSKEALIAVARPDRGNWLQLQSQIARVVGVAVGTFWGLTGVGIGLVIAAILNTALAQRELSKFADISAKSIFASIKHSAFSTAITAGIILISSRVFASVANPLVVFLGSSALCICAWLFVTSRQRHPVSAEIFSMFAKLKKRVLK